jgi:hypothetical protein
MFKYLNTIFCLVFLSVASTASANNIMITDITDSQFSVIWGAQEASSCSLKVFSDSNATQEITSEFSIISESSQNPPAEDNGVMKVTVKQLIPEKTYYVRTVTTPKSSGINEVSENIYEVTTETESSVVSNNILVQQVKQTNGQDAATGSLLIVTIENASSPLSAWVGPGYLPGYAGVDLSNLYNAESRKSYEINSGTLATLYAFGGDGCDFTTSDVVIDESETVQLVQQIAVLNCSGKEIVVAQPVSDQTVNEDSEDLTIDLSNVFDAVPTTENMTTSLISNSNEVLLSASITNNILTISFHHNQNGSANIKIEGSAPEYISAFDEFEINVQPDHPPEVINPLPDIHVNVNSINSEINLSNVFKDPENDQISITAISADDSLVAVSMSNDTLIMDYQSDQTGSTSIEVIGASNGKTATDTFNVFVMSYTPAEISIDDDLRAVSGTTVSISVGLTNPMRADFEGMNVRINYNPDVLTPSETPANLSGILTTDKYDLTADNPSPGQVTLSIFNRDATITDSGVIVELSMEVIGAPGDHTTISFEEAIFNNSQMIRYDGFFIVKSPPISFDDSLSVDEDTTGNVTLNATDADNDNLIYSIVDNGSKGNAVIVDNQTGACTYTPDENENGTDSFTFMVSDGDSSSATATINVTIHSINDAPEISTIEDINGCKNIPISIPFTVSDIDSDLADLTMSYENSSFASLSLEGSGENWTLTVVPLTAFVGTTSITLTVNDGMDSNSTSFDFITNDIGIKLGNDTPTEVYPGQDISVPVFLTSNVEVQSLTMIIQFDSSIISTRAPAAVLTNGILADNGYVLSIVDETENSISLFIESTETPIDATGVIAYLNLTLDNSAGVGDETSISCLNNQAMINDWPMTAYQGEFIIGGLIISGHVGYYPISSDNASELTPVGNVTLTLIGDNNSLTTTSDEDGNYSFINISPGTYTIELSKTDDLNGLSLQDAYWISRHYSQPQHFNCYQQIAGNADDDIEATVRAIDASRVAKYSMKIKPMLNDNDIHWVFLGEEMNECAAGIPNLSDLSSKVISVTSNRHEEDFIAIKVGDVTANWEKSEAILKRSRARKVEKPVPFPVDGDNILLPVKFNQKDKIEGMSLHIMYDSENLQFESASFNQSELEFSKYRLLVNDRNEGHLYLGILAQASPIPMEEKEILLLEFQRQEDDNTVISIEAFECNESSVINGGFIVDDEHVSKRLRIVSESSESLMK